MRSSRLERQVQFLLEIDKLKRVVRRSYVCGGERRENAAEHSWHTALMVLLLAEYSDSPIDPVRAAKMMLIHDLVEIDAGDTFIYDSNASVKQQVRERQAADRIFSMLPDDQAREFRDLWEEFEDSHTAEARFAKAVDRLMPLLHNYNCQGKTWREHGIEKSRVLEVNQRIGAASTTLWEYARELIENSSDAGFLSCRPVDLSPQDPGA